MNYFILTDCKVNNYTISCFHIVLNKLHFRS